MAAPSDACEPAVPQRGGGGCGRHSRQRQGWPGSQVEIPQRTASREGRPLWQQQQQQLGEEVGEEDEGGEAPEEALIAGSSQVAAGSRQLPQRPLARQRRVFVHGNYHRYYGYRLGGWVAPVGWLGSGRACAMAAWVVS